MTPDDYASMVVPHSDKQFHPLGLWLVFLNQLLEGEMLLPTSVIINMELCPFEDAGKGPIMSQEILSNG